MTKDITRHAICDWIGCREKATKDVDGVYNCDKHALETERLNLENGEE